MDVRRRLKYQRVLSLVIAAAGASVSIDAFADQLYKYCTGTVATITGDETAFQNSVFNKFEIDGQEVFPDGYEAKLIGSTQATDVPPNQKYYDFKDTNHILIPYPGNNSKVSIKYTDGSAVGVVYPYTINVYLKLENMDEQMLEDAARYMAWQASQFQQSKA